MTILFDLLASQPVADGDFHGAGEYAKTVFYSLMAGLSSDIRLEVFYDPGKAVDAALMNECQKGNIPVNHCRNNGEISALLRRKQYGVFYTALPYSYYDLIIPPETKFIYTIHGLRSAEYPWDNYILKYKNQDIKTRVKYVIGALFTHRWTSYLRRKSIRNFNLLFTRTKNQIIVTVSRHSKYSINYFFPHIDATIIKTLYSPPKLVHHEAADDKNVLEDLSLEPGKYILLISGDREEKGAYRACKALAKLFSSNTHKKLDDIKIIILGVSQKRSYLKLTRNSSRFVLAAYIPAQNLEALYKNAHLFMYPTLNEGFGYPPLEAMKYGTLCACSANSAITEICGDSVLYFNPFDEIEIGIRVLQSFDQEIRTEKAEKMKTRLETVRKRQEQDLNTLAGIITSSIS